MSTLAPVLLLKKDEPATEEESTPISSRPVSPASVRGDLFPLEQPLRLNWDKNANYSCMHHPRQTLDTLHEFELSLVRTTWRIHNIPVIHLKNENNRKWLVYLGSNGLDPRHFQVTLLNRHGELIGLIPSEGVRQMRDGRWKINVTKYKNIMNLDTGKYGLFRLTFTHRMHAGTACSTCKQPEIARTLMFFRARVSDTKRNEAAHRSEDHVAMCPPEYVRLTHYDGTIEYMRSLMDNDRIEFPRMPKHLTHVHSSVSSPASSYLLPRSYHHHEIPSDAEQPNIIKIRKQPSATFKAGRRKKQRTKPVSPSSSHAGSLPAEFSHNVSSLPSQQNMLAQQAAYAQAQMNAYYASLLLNASMLQQPNNPNTNKTNAAVVGKMSPSLLSLSPPQQQPQQQQMHSLQLQLLQQQQQQQHHQQQQQQVALNALQLIQQQRNVMLGGLQQHHLLQQHQQPQIPNFQKGPFLSQAPTRPSQLGHMMPSTLAIGQNSGFVKLPLANNPNQTTPPTATTTTTTPTNNLPNFF